VPRLSWFARLDRWCWSLEQKRIDDYLAQSVDAADLEWRQRASTGAASGFDCPRLRGVRPRA